MTRRQRRHQLDALLDKAASAIDQQQRFLDEQRQHLTDGEREAIERSRDDLDDLAIHLASEQHMWLPSPWLVGLLLIVAAAVVLGLTVGRTSTEDRDSATAPGASTADATARPTRIVGKNLARVDLSGVDLHEADLTRTCLAGVRLDGADLDRANLDGADLQGASLAGASLNGVTGEFIVDVTTNFGGSERPAGAVDYEPGADTPCD